MCVNSICVCVCVCVRVCVREVSIKVSMSGTTPLVCHMCVCVNNMCVCVCVCACVRERGVYEGLRVWDHASGMSYVCV